MVSPHVNQVPSRMMLAMGGYSALQSFEAGQIKTPRDLPPTGPGPLWVMWHPDGERTRQLFKEHDVRYIVLYKNMPDRPTFENDVLIVARLRVASAAQEQPSPTAFDTGLQRQPRASEACRQRNLLLPYRTTVRRTASRPFRPLPVRFPGRETPIESTRKKRPGMALASPIIAPSAS